MKLIKVAAGVLNQTPMDWENNLENILGCIQLAKDQNISLLCLPELCISGYGCEDMFYAPHISQTALKVLSQIALHTENIIVSVGLPIWHQNRLYNAHAFLLNGNILGFVCKKNLAGTGVYYEPRWFYPWDEGKISDLVIDGLHYPIGDLIFEIDGVKIGYEICQDAWVPNRAGRDLYLRGIDIILNPSASHFEFGKAAVRERLVLEASRAFGVSYIYTNLVGNESGRMIYDGDAIIASCGKGIASGNRFTFHDYSLVSAIIDVSLTRLAQNQEKVHVTKTLDYPHIIVDFIFPDIPIEKNVYEIESWENEFQKEEEFTRAIALALLDYLRKSHSNGWVLSLSGGADSSAVACLCRLAITLCVRSIGFEGLIEKLGYIKDIQNCSNEAQVAETLITCVYQATENSSESTRKSAQLLSGQLNTRYFELNISNLVAEYRRLVENGLGTNFSWEHDDITLQNIQARVRAPGIWIVANAKNALLLSTSNRSEAALGYATMDGDTAGSISPLAGIDKSFLRSWLRWLETQGVNGDIKYNLLSAVNNLSPSPELRPLDQHQTSENDLMPYDLLNSIENAFVRNKKTPAEILKQLTFEFDGSYPADKIKDSIRKFLALWSRNQWKRDRYAPSFHLDEYSLDPKSWCRFPLLSGGFTYELKNLE